MADIINRSTSVEDVVKKMLLAYYLNMMQTGETSPFESLDYSAAAVSVNRLSEDGLLARGGAALEAAYAFYYENVEIADWGCARVYEVSHIYDLADSSAPALATGFIMVRVSTDGDDGWIECFDASNNNDNDNDNDNNLRPCILAGRSYLELFHNMTHDIDLLRQNVFDFGYPDGFNLDASQVVEKNRAI